MNEFKGRDLVVRHPTAAIHVDGMESSLECAVFGAVIGSMQEAVRCGRAQSQGDLFFIDREDFRRLVGRYESNRDDDIIRACEKLMNVQFSWDTFRKGKFRFAGRMNFLSTFVMDAKEGFGFRLNPDVGSRINFIRPQLAGRYRMLELQAMKGDYTRRLYQFLVEDYGRVNGEREVDRHTTEWCGVDELKRYLNASAYKRYDDFKYLKKEVLAPACEEIGEVSSFGVEVILRRDGRKVSHVAFVMRRRVQMRLDLTTQPTGGIVQELEALGIVRGVAERWIRDQGDELVREALEYVRRMNTTDKPIANVPGYLAKLMGQESFVAGLKAKMAEVRKREALVPLLERMTDVKSRCQKEMREQVREGWLALSDEQRVSFWQEWCAGAGAAGHGALRWVTIGDVTATLRNDEFISGVLEEGDVRARGASPFRIFALQRLGIADLEARLETEGYGQLTEAIENVRKAA